MANTQKHILLYVLGSYRYVTNQHTQQFTTTHVHQLRASGGQESGRGSLAAVSHQARVKVLAKAVGSLEADWSSPHTPLVVGRIDLFLVAELSLRFLAGRCSQPIEVAHGSLQRGLVHHGHLLVPSSRPGRKSPGCLLASQALMAYGNLIME